MSQIAPVFLTINSITNVSQITDSAGTTDAVQARLFDRASEIQYRGIGESSGTRTITWTPAAATTIGRIIVQNCNWKTFAIKHSGTTDFSSAISETDSTATHFYYSFNEVNVTSVNISITATHTSSVAITCGELYVGRLLMAVPSTCGSILVPRPMGGRTIIDLSDGTHRVAHVRETVDWDLTLQGVSAGDRTTLMTVWEYSKRYGVWWVPYPTSGEAWLGDGGHYVVLNQPTWQQHTGDIRGAGYDIGLQLGAMGG